MGKSQPASSSKSRTSSTEDILSHLAFDNSLRANVITTASNGKLIMANKAACRLLGYTKKELLTKGRTSIFDLKDNRFKTMLKERNNEGQSEALVNAIKKSGKLFLCKITSAIFTGEDGVKKAITTIADMRPGILLQRNIDIKKEKIVADNIALGISKQKAIDINKNKVVADDIAFAISKQKVIDLKKEKIVADNIAFAISKQKTIDIDKNKVVADDIAFAISKQKAVDLKKEKAVANNIALAKSKQRKIDVKKEKIVADNIILAQAKSDTRLEENNQWIKYIAKTSYDVMWDWDVTTGEMYVGDSMEEVFGYKVQKNKMSSMDFNNYILTGEKDAVEKKLFKALKSGKKSWNDSFKFKRCNGSVASTITRAYIVRDENGKAIRMIGNIQDISRLQELKKKLAERNSAGNENSDSYQHAAKLTYDGIWDWNLLTNKFFLGEGFKQIFGSIHKKRDKMSSDWTNYLHPDDKEIVKREIGAVIESSATHWEREYRFVKPDGYVVNVFCRTNIIRDAAGKACRMIGAVHDLSLQKNLEDKLKGEISSSEKLLTEYKKNFKLIFNSSSDILYDIDLINNEVTLSDMYEKELGHKINNNITSTEEFFSHIHPDDIKGLLKDYNRMLASKDIEWKQSFRFIKADHSIANIVSKGIVLRNIYGKAYRLIGYLLDVSKQMILEEKLEHEIKLKEKQIKDAAEKAREIERSDIGKELHDNINQLLGASKLYLDMAKRGGANAKMYLSRSSEYTLMAIEEIRKLTKGLTTDTIKNLGLYDAVSNITRDIMEVNPLKISCDMETFKEDSVNDKFKLNIFRIIQEKLNNIIKYSKAKEAVIRLSQNIELITLIISDNGIGFNTGIRRKGIGIANIKSRAETYKGVVDLVSQKGNGCVLTIRFPFSALIAK